MADPSPTPVKPSTIPAWALRASAVALPVIGLALDYFDPTGKFNKSGVQALVFLGFLFAGLIIIAIHIVLSAVHEHGWSIASAKQVEDDLYSEAKNALPAIEENWAKAQPFLDELPGVSSRIGDLEAGLAGLKESADAAPNADKTEAFEAVKTWLLTTRIGPLIADAPAPAPAAPVADTKPAEAAPAPLAPAADITEAPPAIQADETLPAAG